MTLEPPAEPYRFSQIFRNQTVIVTGAGRGIGREIALAFARAGANVVCVARTASEITAVVSTIESFDQGGHGLAIAGDVSEPGFAQSVHEMVLRAFGSVDVLVNNAGIDKINTVEHEKDFESWWRVVEVNLRGPVALIQQVLPTMLAQGHGVIISIGSRNAVMNIPFTTAYSVSKTGLLRFHQCLEHEIRGRGVFNYYLQPGDVATTLTHGDGVIDFDTAEKVPEMQKMLENSIGQCATPATLVASVCLRLATEENARILSGLYLDAEEDLDSMIKRMRAELQQGHDPSTLYQLTVQRT
jgi:NAD(P)-dependent dehydrogenase (short-subunit alcohol dehydrogenase family)